MKYYTEICIYCFKEREATQIDQLPIPNTAMLYTKGWVPVPRMVSAWVSCNLLREHTFVNKDNYLHGQISVDGRTIIPKISA